MSKLDTDEPHGANEKAKDFLNRLIAPQGIRPIDDLEQLAALWPADDNPDALMNFVLSERQARVQLKTLDQQSGPWCFPTIQS